MTTVAEALDQIYDSLLNDNVEIDARIKVLKEALTAEGLKEVRVDTARIAQNNRQGRKTMQAYFKKRGVTVGFDQA